MSRTTYKGEEILHRVLWRIVEEESQTSVQSERGWFNPALVAMVFAFHTIEAYLNYVGKRLAPEIWKDERNYFRKQPHRGWEGKLRKVLELVSIPWSPASPPLSTVLELRQLRDLIGHGKPEKLAGEVIHPLGSEAPFLSSTIWQMATPKEKLEPVLSDVQAFLCQIHSSASPKLKVEDIWFGKHPLHGPSEYVMHSTSLY